MEKFDEGSLNFGLAGSGEYDEYEEEVIERDEYADDDYDGEEYYDDDGEYYDEDDDGYYADEGYPLEEYGPYEDAPVGDDKLSKVLDELAELKRSVANQPQQMPYHPPFIAPPSAVGPNDLSLYNEISRLRDELGRTQASQDMHVELSRLKDQTERDARHSEAEFLREIRRLNEKVEELAYEDVKKNDNVGKLLQTEANSLLMSGKSGASVSLVGEDVLREEFRKLIGINEAILTSVKETDQKSHAQLSEVRKRIAAIPDFTHLSQRVDELKQTLEDFEKVGNASGILKELREVKVALGAPPPVTSAVLDSDAVLDKIDGIKGAVTATDNSEVLRQIYDLKAFIGVSNVSAAKRNTVVLGLYNDLSRVKFDSESKMLTLSEKLTSIDAFAKKLSLSSEPEAYNIYRLLLTVSNRLLSEKLTRNTVEALREFAMNTGSVAIAPKKQEAAEFYAKLTARIKRSAIMDSTDLLRELADAVDLLQDGEYTEYNETLYREILDLTDEYAAADEAAAAAILNKIGDRFDRLCCLTAADLADYTPISTPKIYKPPISLDGSALFDKLDELKIILSDLNSASEDGTPLEGSVGNGIVLAEITALKNELYTTLNQDEILNAVAALKQNTFDILEQIDAVIPKDTEAQLDTLYEDLTAALAETALSLTNQIGGLNTTVAGIAGDISGLADIDAKIALIAADVEEIKKRILAAAETSEAAIQQSVLVGDSKIAGEISEMRNLLENSESITKEQAESIQGQVSELLEEVVTLKADLTTGELLGVDTTLHEESIVLMLNEISEKMQTMLYGTGGGENINNIEILVADVNEIKEKVFAASDTQSAAPTNDELNMLVGEVVALRDEIQAYRDEIKLAREEAEETANGGGNDASALSEIENQNVEILNALFDELNALRADVQTFNEEIVSLQKGDAEAARNGVEELKEIVSSQSVTAEHETSSGVSDGLNAVLNELTSVKESINELRREVDGIKTERSASHDADINNVKDMLAKLLSGQESHKQEPAAVGGIADDTVAMLVDELSAIKDELVAGRASVSANDSASENLALLIDEITSLKTQMATGNNEPANAAAEGALEAVIVEVQKLRDQIFAISMANVSAGSDVAEYETYNNLILDELNTVREELVRVKNAEAFATVSDELAAIKESVRNNGELTQIQNQLVGFKGDIEAIKADAKQIETIKAELIASRDAGEALTNFLSGVVTLLEQQNKQPAAPVVSDKIEEKLASFKREISATVSESARISSTSAMQEIFKLKAEIERIKPSDNTSVLKEIQRIKDEISVLNHDKNRRLDSEKDLSRSLFDLKEELNQIADFVNENEAEPAQAAVPVLEKKTEVKKVTSKKFVEQEVPVSVYAEPEPDLEPFFQEPEPYIPAFSTKHNGSGKKKSAARIEALLETPEPELEPYKDELLSKINRESETIVQEIETESYEEKEMYVASSLAKQVANKLIIEQLLVQLGDGDVPAARVEEIVKDILPQEFSTVQMDEQNDKVRRLANSLVLDKLRARLPGKK